jgi:glutamate--cysteine ligase catalytic subunit
LRFKPPPSQNSSIGWRVEFRTMDIQLTDFENTCLIVALGLIVNVINHFDVNFIIPITLADENMKRAHYRDGILKEKFWFNTASIKNFIPLKDIEKYNYLKSSNDSYVEPIYEELFIHEIFGGKKESNFPGIYSLIKEFMQLKEYNIEY